jgi:hypothetical protein
MNAVLRAYAMAHRKPATKKKIARVKRSKR